VSGAREGLVGLMGASTLGKRLEARCDRPVKTEPVRTPYGSVDVVTGSIAGGRFAAVSKSGVAPFPGHQLPYRATLMALSKVGAGRILSTSVATSLTADLRFADCFVADDFLDLTGRSLTFFDGGLEGTHHAEMEAPFCRRLSKEFASVARSFGVRVLLGGTIATVPGPHHPTSAEAARLSSLGATAVGFSAATEAKLARELGICFVSAAVAVRSAEEPAPWRQSGRSEAAEAPSEADLLRAFTEGRDVPAAEERPRKAAGKMAGSAHGASSRRAREAQDVKAKLLDVDRRLEDAAAAFVPQAAAMVPCPYCSRGAGPPPA
jgi:5'-methylthioadenosine phosphorylase